MKLFDVYPINKINIVKGLGSFIWDDMGTRYLDMYGGHAVISIGHCHERWIQSITEQLNKIAYYSNSVIIEQKEELAEKLGEVSGKHNYQLFLVNSGAEANENALKIASFHTNRKKIISFTNGFHGRTSLAVALTDNKTIIAPVNQTENAIILPFNDEQRLVDYFKLNGNEVGGVIVEGIQGVGGINEANKSFLKLIRELCDQYGSVYIADSIQCGYGRTGQFFAHDDAGVEADIYTMAKGMGNGYPIGAIILNEKFKASHGLLGTTFGGNHLACTAAIAVLDVIKENNLIENAKNVGNYLISNLKSIKGIEKVRGRGLMIGFETNQDNQNLRNELLENEKIFTGNAKPNVIRLLPSLSMTKQEADIFLNATKNLLK